MTSRDVADQLSELGERYKAEAEAMSKATCSAERDEERQVASPRA